MVAASQWFLLHPVGVANLATRWHEVPSPPLKGEVPNEREAEGFLNRNIYNGKPLSQPVRAASF